MFDFSCIDELAKNFKRLYFTINSLGVHEQKIEQKLINLFR